MTTFGIEALENIEFLLKTDSLSSREREIVLSFLRMLKSELIISLTENIIVSGENYQEAMMAIDAKCQEWQDEINSMSMNNYVIPVNPEKIEVIKTMIANLQALKKDAFELSGITRDNVIQMASHLSLGITPDTPIDEKTRRATFDDTAKYCASIVYNEKNVVFSSSESQYFDFNYDEATLDSIFDVIFNPELKEACLKLATITRKNSTAKKRISDVELDVKTLEYLRENYVNFILYYQTYYSVQKELAKFDRDIEFYESLLASYREGTVFDILRKVKGDYSKEKLEYLLFSNKQSRQKLLEILDCEKFKELKENGLERFNYESVFAGRDLTKISYEEFFKKLMIEIMIRNHMMLDSIENLKRSDFGTVEKTLKEAYQTHIAIQSKVESNTNEDILKFIESQPEEIREKLQSLSKNSNAETIEFILNHNDKDVQFRTAIAMLLLKSLADLRKVSVEDIRNQIGARQYWQILNNANDILEHIPENIQQVIFKQEQLRIRQS